ncbi:hypothetical protein ACQUY5_25735 [Bacillus cereus]|uniref:hypothetical protein n=1 Tax=Bacillus cereus TaxID=1396 RepID=UPI003D17CB6A
MDENRDWIVLSIEKRLEFLVVNGHKTEDVVLTLEHEFSQSKQLVKEVVQLYYARQGFKKNMKIDTKGLSEQELKNVIDKRTTELIEKGLPYKEVISTLVDEFYGGTGALIRGSLYRYVDKLEFSDVKNQ